MQTNPSKHVCDYPAYDGKCPLCRTKIEKLVYDAAFEKMRKYIIKIGNKHHKDTGEYCGRGSPLGNPYVIGKHGNRAEVIARYKDYLQREVDSGNPTIINELDRIGHKLLTEGSVTLLCFCNPAPCHTVHIKALLERALVRLFIEEKLNDSLRNT